LQKSIDHQTTSSAPASALTWTSGKDRNRKLIPWRRAMWATFGGHARCMRIGWLLDNLFKIEAGYAHAPNDYLASESGMRANKVQEVLAILENGGAIIRTYVIYKGRKQRVIFPSAALIRHPRFGGAQHPLLEGVHKLNHTPRLPKTEFQRARLAHEIAECREAERRANVSARHDGQ